VGEVEEKMKEKFRVVYGEQVLRIEEPVIEAIIKKLIREIVPLFHDEIVKALTELESKGDVYVSYSARLFPSFFRLTISVIAVRDNIVVDERTIAYEKEFQGDKFRLYEEIVRPKLRPYEEIEEFYLDP
jgi:hypothetical protein